MPLLHKQKFVPVEIPKDLSPDQQIFFSRQTREIFLDYDQYFERTILCNSLVWTCSLTGKQGLTFCETIDSEKKARKQMANFPGHLLRAVVYLISLTKRGNIKDLIEDIMSFAKDRYFLGETVILNKEQTKSDAQKTIKIVDIILPVEGKKTKNDDSMDTNSESTVSAFQVNPEKVKYSVEIESKINGSCSKQIMRAGQIRRINNTLTKDKVHIIVKTCCDVVESVWQVTTASRKKYNLDSASFAEFFKGVAPQFGVSYGRGQFSKLSKSSAKEKSPKNKKTPESKLHSAKSPKQTVDNKLDKSLGKSNDKKSEKSEKSLKQSKSKAKLMKEEKAIEEEICSEVLKAMVSEVLEKQAKDMTSEEFSLWREHLPEEDLKDLTQLETEYQKLQKREELAKEKERAKQEKLKEKQKEIELKKPKEDFETEDLKTLPKPQPVSSKISQEMLGDATLILEFLNNFGELFELGDDFPGGFNFDLLENALFSKSTDSALCNLLLFFLDSVFKCLDEEVFEDEADNDDDETEVLCNGDSTDESIGLDTLYKVPESAGNRDDCAQHAEEYAQLIKSVQGRSLKKIGLDVYTISEMLRLYFLTSGCEHYSKIKFWYQQRGGYTRMDEVGLDFSLNHREILKKLETTLVYELDPQDKLHILASLCHQLISHVRFRDYTEDNLQKVSLLKAQLRELQTEENRRQRDEASAQWRKRNEDRLKEKAKLEEMKVKPSAPQEQSQIDKESVQKLAAEAKLQAESTVKREVFLKKERALKNEIYELHYKCSMQPIGKDRYCRRYWSFKSLPGLFVEDATEGYMVDKILELGHSKSRHVVDSQNTAPVETEKLRAESEPVINGKSQEHKPQLSDLTNLSNTGVMLNGSTKTSPEHDNQSEVVKAEPEQNIRPDYVRDECRWSVYTNMEDVNKLLDSLNERGVRESELKQNLIDLRDSIATNLTRKAPILVNLTLAEEDVEARIRSCLRENLNSVLANHLFHNPKQNKRQATKIAAELAKNNFAEHTCRKYLELDLRDKLLDFEEQIFVGSLGSLKSNERVKWKQSVTSSQFDTNSESDKQTTLTTLCTALVQLEKSVERRFLRSPLGEAQNTPSKKRVKPTTPDKKQEDQDKYQVLLNWERSLTLCTNYSQVYVHLQSLDESIAWSKSAMNARCRLCKRKGDAEKMLLCDKCDNGHHMYCLRPQLEAVPDGQWFCPECKPKEIDRTPRKVRDYEKDGQSDAEDKTDEEEDEEENDTMDDNSDDTDVKSDISTKRKKRSKKAIESTEEESDEDEEEEENVQEEEERIEDEDENVEDDEEEEEANETQESTAEEDHNDSDFAATSRNAKFKFNGFKIGGKKSVTATDEEMAEESNDEVDKKRTRKRKLTEEKIAMKNSRAKSQEVLSRGGRRRPVYAEFSDDQSADTDSDDKKQRKKHKKGDASAEEDLNMNTSSRNTDVGQRIKVIEKLINELMKHEDGWPFLKPVSKREAPDYHEVIERPMDFSTIKNNINNFKYDDYTSIVEDIRLVFQNCREYNEPGSDIYTICQRLSNFFEKEAKKAGLLDTKQLARPNK